MEFKNHRYWPLTLLLIYSCHGRKDQVHPMRGTVTESVYASGIVKSNDQYQIFANENGLVSELFITEGDMVKKGTVLLRLSDVSVKLNEENA